MNPVVVDGNSGAYDPASSSFSQSAYKSPPPPFMPLYPSSSWSNFAPDSNSFAPDSNSYPVRLDLPYSYGDQYGWMNPRTSLPSYSVPVSKVPNSIYSDLNTGTSSAGYIRRQVTRRKFIDSGRRNGRHCSEWLGDKHPQGFWEDNNIRPSLWGLGVLHNEHSFNSPDYSVNAYNPNSSNDGYHSNAYYSAQARAPSATRFGSPICCSPSSANTHSASLHPDPYHNKRTYPIYNGQVISTNLNDEDEITYFDRNVANVKNEFKVPDLNFPDRHPSENLYPDAPEDCVLKHFGHQDGAIAANHEPVSYASASIFGHQDGFAESLHSIDPTPKSLPSRKDIQLMVRTLHCLSEVLANSGGAFELEEHDHELVLLAVNNIEVFIIENKKGDTKDNPPCSGLEAVVEEMHEDASEVSEKPEVEYGESVLVASSSLKLEESNDKTNTFFMEKSEDQQMLTVLSSITIGESHFVPVVGSTMMGEFNDGEIVASDLAITDYQPNQQDDSISSDWEHVSEESE